MNNINSKVMDDADDLAIALDNAHTTIENLLMILHDATENTYAPLPEDREEALDIQETRLISLEPYLRTIQDTLRNTNRDIAETLNSYYGYPSEEE